MWHCAAFWTAVLLYRSGNPARFTVALVTGAAFAHLGWAALHLPSIVGHPRAILDPSVGFTVLFFPLGVLAFCREPDAWRSLPLALAVARLGCWVVGCCSGVSAPWGVHPVALYDLLLLVVLHWTVKRVDDPWVGSAFCVGFALIRILVEPLRAVPPLGEPILAPAIVALAWLLFGGVWAGVSLRAVVLHETAHAPGLTGHSEEPRDILYPSVVDDRIPGPSERDRATLRELDSRGNRQIRGRRARPGI